VLGDRHVPSIISVSALVIGAAFASLPLSSPAQAIPPSADSAAAPTAQATEVPAALMMIIEDIEAAANAQDMERLMAFYSSDFEGADGFTRDQYRETLSQFWADYATLTYEVSVLSWESAGEGFVAVTTTAVTGTKEQSGRTFTLTSAVQSRQRYENGQIVAQEILDERSRLATGANPPTVTVRLPETVSPGREFTFDAIVEEPLGDRLLLGRALDEGATAQDFLTPRPLDLEQLTAGGLFKTGTAPTKPDQRWISAVLIREDGFVVETRRLQVEN